MKTNITNTFFLILLLGIVTSCKIQNQQLECKDFINGTFEFYDNEINKKYILIRKNESQIEKVYNLTTNELEINPPRIMKITWLNECEYNAMLDTTKSKFDELDLQMISAGGVNNKIIKIVKNCAETEASIGNFKKNFKICKKN